MIRMGLGEKTASHWLNVLTESISALPRGYISLHAQLVAIYPTLYSVFEQVSLACKTIITSY